MKNRFFIASLALMGTITTLATSMSNNRVVDYPVINYANTSVLDISKVELNDSNTVVHFNAYYRPHYWIKISSGLYLSANGKKYALTASENITPDSLLWMPDDGKAEFKLIFEPLPLTVQKFDCVEGEEPGDFRLINIDLSGNSDLEYPDGLPNEFNKELKDGPMPYPAFEIGTTTINFHLLPNIKQMVGDMNLYVNKMGGKQQEIPVMFDGNGNATVSFDQYGTATGFLVDASNPFTLGDYTFYPGETIDCYVDMRLSGLQAMKHRNPDKQGNACWSIHNGKYSNFDLMKEKGSREYPYYGLNLYTGDFGDYRMTGPQYMAMVKGKYDSFLDSIASLDAPEMIKEIKKTELQNDVLEAIARYRYILEHNYCSTHNEWNESNLKDSIQGTLTDADYAEVTKWFDIDNPKLVFPRTQIGLIDWNARGAKGDLSKSFKLYAANAAKAESMTLTKEDLDELKTLSNPFFAAACDSIYQRSKRKYEQLKSSVSCSPTPNVPDEEIFDAIISQHKGKVVMVDLWNTWCGPCRMALKASEPLKDSVLSDQDIVWIYIADESSDPNKYLEMIPDIRGIHYKLTRKQVEAIHDRFNVDGIPYYILVDRDGNAEGRPDLRNHSEYVKAIKSKL